MNEPSWGGRYRLLAPLALGGMGSVWRAIDEATGEPVAIKRLHPHLAADDGARARLHREASALAALRHPNIVSVRDFLDDPDEPALVMELVEGPSLAERISSDGPLAEPAALALAAGLADALAAAHARGLVHRDVKPANVLVGNDGQARLSDFGIAAWVDEAASGITAADGVAGTLRYVAPERLSGAVANPSTDVWGVGATLYEMVTGRPAYPVVTVDERVRDAQRAVERPPELSGRAWEVVRRSMAVDPADRYPDGAALAAALHALPGVPAALTLDVNVDDGAPTEVIPLPGVAASSTVAASAASFATVGSRKPTEGRRGLRLGPAPLAGATALVVLVAALALGGSTGDAGSRQFESVEASDAPTVPPAEAVDPVADEMPEPEDDGVAAGEDAQSKGKDDQADKDAKKDKGKGKGHGRGNGD